MVTIVTRKAKNGIFARKTLGATDLKLAMNIQLHSGSNMGWVPPGHTFLFLCKAKNAKNGKSAKTLEPKELDHKLIYIFLINIIWGMF